MDKRIESNCFMVPGTLFLVDNKVADNRQMRLLFPESIEGEHGQGSLLVSL